jgi:hypothetical protein
MHADFNYLIRLYCPEKPLSGHPTLFLFRALPFYPSLMIVSKEIVYYGLND